jgi:hypothetical protein
MSTIINLRGTNASGKSTAVRAVMEYYGVAEEHTYEDGGKVIGYKLNNGLNIVGRYQSDCGGCDSLDDFDEIKSLVRSMAVDGPVLFEGVLWSTVFKSTAEFATANPSHQFIFATLDTPVEECVARLRHRNEAKAAREGKPVKYSSADGLRSKHATILRAHSKLLAAGLDARMVDHHNAVATLLTWLDGRICPACGKPGWDELDSIQPDINNDAFCHAIIDGEPILCTSDYAD